MAKMGENIEQENKTLQEINDENAELLLPVLVLYVSIMCIGIIGNAVVIVIYAYRFQLSPRKIFILTLALLDFTTCSVGLPYHVLDILDPYMFKYILFCKISTVTILFVYVSSIAILIIIGVDRYLKICRPFKMQITTRGAKYICGILIFASLVMAFPIFEFYGYSTIDTGYGNITGVECFFSDEYKNKSFPVIYHVILLSIFVAATIALLALYSLICKELYISRRRLSLDKKKMNSHRSNSGENIMEANACMLSSMPGKGQSKEVVSKFEGKSTSAKLTINEGMECPVAEKSGSGCQLDSHESEEARGDSKYDPTTFDLITDEESGEKEKMQIISIQVLRCKDKCFGDRSRGCGFRFVSWILRCKTNINKMKHGESERRRAIMKVLKDKRTLKTTYTMFTITAVFILSYLPTFYMTIHSLIYPGLWDSISDDKLVLYHILIRSYLINNMMNPVVYGLLDEKFRKECFRIPWLCNRR